MTRVFKYSFHGISKRRPIGLYLFNRNRFFWAFVAKKPHVFFRDWETIRIKRASLLYQSFSKLFRGQTTWRRRGLRTCRILFPIPEDLFLFILGRFFWYMTNFYVYEMTGLFSYYEISMRFSILNDDFMLNKKILEEG